LHGIETISLRYFNVYGPRQSPESDYAAVIPKFITRLLAGIHPTIFGDGKQTRDFLFVEDIVRANLLAATTDHANGECFNIAGGRAISLNELFAVLAKVAGSSLRPVYAPERPGDIKHSHADVSRAKDVLGFVPSFDLPTGLAKTVEYYRLSAAQ
jgi:nucleoside-diphosphate-sugar epimerase